MAAPDEGTLWEGWNAEKQAHWAERRFGDHMAACETAWRAGIAQAVTDAVSWCRVYQQPPPVWLEQAVARVVAQQLTPAEAKQRYEAMQHYARWDAVMELRRRKDEMAEDGIIDRITSWEQTWEVVSEHLAKTDAACGSHMVKKSYEKVQRDLSEGRGGQYYIGLPRR